MFSELDGDAIGFFVSQLRKYRIASHGKNDGEGEGAVIEIEEVS